LLDDRAKANEALSSSANGKVWSLIWNSKALPKCKNLAWRAASNILPIVRNLGMRRIINDPICLLWGECLSCFSLLSLLQFASSLGLSIIIGQFHSLEDLTLQSWQMLRKFRSHIWYPCCGPYGGGEINLFFKVKIHQCFMKMS